MQLQQVLDGRLVDGTGDTELRIDEPATGTVLATGRAAGPRDVEAAVRSARRAHEKAWGRAPGMVRTRHLLALAAALQRHAGTLATLEARDTGTPRTQVVGRDLPAALALLRHHAGWADKLAHLARTPEPRALGVSVHLLPPVAALADVLAEVAPALAAGCTVLVLAPEAAPLTTLALGGLAAEAGLPAGVLTVLAGPVRPELLRRRDVEVVTVTGAAPAVVAVRRALVGSPTRTVSRVHGEQVVVALDLDATGAATAAAVDLAVDGVRAHTRRLAGGLTLVVPAASLDDVRARLEARLAALVVGDPLDPATDVGPVAGAGLVTPSVVDVAAGGPELAVTGTEDDDALLARVGGDPHARVRLLGEDVERLRSRVRGRTAADAPASPREYLHD